MSFIPMLTVVWQTYLYVVIIVTLNRQFVFFVCCGCFLILPSTDIYNMFIISLVTPSLIHIFKACMNNIQNCTFVIDCVSFISL